MFKRVKLKIILNRLQKEACKQGYVFEKAKFNEFFWIKSDTCFHLHGYKPDYDIRADFGNKYPHDIYKIVNAICTTVFGKSVESHTPQMDKTRDSYWGTSYEKWRICNVEIVNYMYGHPKSGFFHSYLFIHTGKLNCKIM